jgi:hypothetical protein
MGFLQYSLTKAINIRNTYLVLEPYGALLILREFRTSTFRNKILDLLYLSITNLTFTNFLFQGRFHINSVGVSRPGGVPGPTSEMSPRAPAQMGRREAEREGGK